MKMLDLVPTRPTPPCSDGSQPPWYVTHIRPHRRESPRYSTLRARRTRSSSSDASVRTTLARTSSPNVWRSCSAPSPPTRSPCVAFPCSNSDTRAPEGRTSLQFAPSSPSQCRRSRVVHLILQRGHRRLLTPVRDHILQHPFAGVREHVKILVALFENVEYELCLFVL